MKRTAISVLILLLLVFSLFSCNENTTADDKLSEVQSEIEVSTDQPSEYEDFIYDQVVLICVDGCASFFKDAQTPNFDSIFENGAVTYSMEPPLPSYEAWSYGDMLHGVVPQSHRLSNSIADSEPYDTSSDYPSIFKVIRAAFPDADLASFASWSGINTGIIEDGIGVTKSTAESDDDIIIKLTNYIGLKTPKLLFLQFGSADDIGYEYGYGSDEHKSHITKIDEYIGDVYKLYKQKNIIDKTLFIVTGDCGGYIGENMGVMFAVSGSSVTAKGSITSLDENGNVCAAQTRDTAAVILHALGLDIYKTYTATVPRGIFDGTEAVTRPYYEIKYDYPHRNAKSTPTPENNSGSYLTDIFPEDEVYAYITLDGEDDNTVSNGDITYSDGYFGSSAIMDNGSVTVSDFAPGKSSFSVAFWMKTNGVAYNADPLLIANKDWESSKNPGFALALRSETLRFNLGDGTNSLKLTYDLPRDARDGWVHIIAVVDRENQSVRLCYDFGEFLTDSIPAELVNSSFDGINGLVIGQDGTLDYVDPLPAKIDDVIIFNTALTQNDIEALALYYGIE